MMKVPADKGGPKGLNITLKPLSITQGNVEREKTYRKITDVGKNYSMSEKTRKLQTMKILNFTLITTKIINNKKMLH